MKKNRITWAFSLTALCLLFTACSEENNEPTGPQTRTLTVGCNIGKTPDTRAGVTPGNPDQARENFIWHTGDKFHGWLIREGGSSFEGLQALFEIDPKYSDAAPSNSATFTSPNFPTENYQMLATYPSGSFQLNANEALEYTIFYRATQNGKNDTRHLWEDMKMYGFTSAASSPLPAMTFHHLTSLVRFTVTNTNARACKITGITITGDNETLPFGQKYTLTFDKTNQTVTSSCTKDLYDVPSLSTENIELSAAKGNSFNAYMIVGASQTPLTDKKLIFTIKATDINDSNARTYTSLALDANQIIAANGGALTWEPGKRYWFDLLLDDDLTATLKEVTNLPGWDNETDL